jgi:catechol 2,3-dioxygenase-like lactoylglutathione lyase family enzyme
MTPSAPDQPVLELRVAVTTRDFERLLRFYATGLGLEPAQIWTSEHGQAILLEMGRGTLEVFDEAHARHIDEIEAGQPVSGPIRFALGVPDVQAAVDRLLAHGASLVHPPVLTPWGHWNARMQDPDGLQVTLFQALRPE